MSQQGTRIFSMASPYRKHLKQPILAFEIRSLTTSAIRPNFSSHLTRAYSRCSMLRTTCAASLTFAATSERLDWTSVEYGTSQISIPSLDTFLPAHHINHLYIILQNLNLNPASDPRFKPSRTCSTTLRLIPDSSSVVRVQQPCV